jgi:hypothetical protein
MNIFIWSPNLNFYCCINLLNILKHHWITIEIYLRHIFRVLLFRNNSIDQYWPGWLKPLVKTGGGFNRSTLLVSSWSIFKNIPLWNCSAKWTEIRWEAPVEGSVLSFLKAEWKVSDTGSAHWASSLITLSNYLINVSFSLIFYIFWTL